jgi:hypothetical protein
MTTDDTSQHSTSIFQIFYDAKSHSDLDKGFIPLDNSSSEHPEFYEFWPILQFLRSNTLVEGHWYGFLSPKFHQKTGLSSAQLYKILGSISSRHQVFLAPYTLDQIIWFDNVFDQGDFWHPGLIQVAQAFVNYAKRLNLEI